MSDVVVSSCPLCGAATVQGIHDRDEAGTEYHTEFDCDNGHQGVMDVRTVKAIKASAAKKK